MKKIARTVFVILIFCFLSCGEEKMSDVIEASGTIEATDITISSKTAGQLKEIMVIEGEKITKDQILAVLDHESLDIQLRQAQAAVEQSEAQLHLLLAGPQKEDIRLAQEKVKLAEINLQQAETERERTIKLYESNVVTEQQYQIEITKYEQAENQLMTAKENLKKVKNIVRPEEIESARANVKRNKVSIELIQKNIDDCTIKSPVSGIMTKKFVEAGEYVIPGSSLMNISELDIVKLVIYVTEPELGRIKLGQYADVSIDTYKDKVYKGEVIYISTEAEFTPKTIQTKEERTKLVYAVKIQLPNSDYELKSGMPADAILKFTKN